MPGEIVPDQEPPNLELRPTESGANIALAVALAVGGPGTRAARLSGHAKNVARKARGLEAALINKFS
jgi:hypothetical protein